MKCTNPLWTRASRKVHTNLLRKMKNKWTNWSITTCAFHSMRPSPGWSRTMGPTCPWPFLYTEQLLSRCSNGNLLTNKIQPFMPAFVRKLIGRYLTNNSTSRSWSSTIARSSSTSWTRIYSRRCLCNSRATLSSFRPLTSMGDSSSV